eukprot:COSAG04_NODE_3975_length_2387_cov_1.486451_1_plen_67_part_10
MAAAVPLGEGSLPLDGQSVGRMRPSAADDGMDVLRSRLSHDGVNLPHSSRAAAMDLSFCLASSTSTC